MLNSEAVRMTRMEVLDVENVADIMVTVDSAVAKQHWQCVPKLYRHIVPSLSQRETKEKKVETPRTAIRMVAKRGITWLECHASDFSQSWKSLMEHHACQVRT